MSSLTDARELALIVWNVPGGGLHRSELEDRASFTGDRFRRAIMTAYSRKWIDFCRYYVVKPPVKSE